MKLAQTEQFFILNAKRSYKVLVRDFPINKDWHIFVDEEEIIGHGCVSIGDCICWCEALEENKHKPSHHTEIVRRLIATQEEAGKWYEKYCKASGNEI